MARVPQESKRKAPQRSNLSSGIREETFSEIDSVDHLRHQVERWTGGGYIVWRPDQWRQPVVNGLAADTLCELGYASFHKFPITGPSRKKNTWGFAAVNYRGPMLCKNAKTVSKLPMP